MVVRRLLSALPMLLSGRYDDVFKGSAVSIPAAAPLMPRAVNSNSPAQHPHSRLRLLSWNLLATPYVRHPRESEAQGLSRARKHMDYVAASDADVVALQEFWVASPNFVALWKELANRHGYILHLCPRVDGKADGCAMLVKASRCAAPPTFSAYTYNDCA
jgi:mRNA deadenylase 3'-5' endonuclease subunit Ccr4